MPTLNELLKGERVTFGSRNHFSTKGHNIKKEWQTATMWAIRKQLGRVKATPPVDIHYVYYEPKRNRDKGNIHGFAQKIIEDAMQDAGLINNDNWQWIRHFTAEFYVDAKNPRIEVIVEEVRDD